MRLAVRPPAYFPRLAELALAARAEALVLGDTFAFSRQSTHNRARIRSTAGAMWLSVPVGTAHGRRLDGVALDAWPEAARHARKALRFSYGKAPFYEHYADALDALLAAEHSTLAALACATTDWLFARFGLPAPRRASSLPGAPATLAEVVSALPATSLLVLPETLARDRAALASPVEALPVEALPVEALDWAERPYRQPFAGFVPGLSALDALMMRGPHARALLGA